MTDDIRKATGKDLAAIKTWLQAERQETGEGFFCNWNVIERAFSEGDLYVLAVNDDVVGFIVDGPRGPDIVEIRPGARGIGYGRRLAEWAIASAFARGNSVIEGECAPETSIPFWQKLGFTVSPNRTEFGGGIYAYRVLDRHVELPDGQHIPFEIEFFPRARDHNPNMEPFRTYTGKGLVLQDGSIQLPERAICFTPRTRELYDCVVRIVVDGIEIFEDKVKRPAAKSLGVSQDAGSIYYLDRIVWSEAS